MMWIATLETRHFSFMAAGNTEEHVRDVLRLAWKKHARETGATYTADEMIDDARIQRIEAGSCLRDGEQIIKTD